MTKPVLVDISETGENHVVDLVTTQIIVEVLAKGPVRMILVRDDLRRTEWERLKVWADKMFGE